MNDFSASGKETDGVMTVHDMVKLTGGKNGGIEETVLVVKFPGQRRPNVEFWERGKENKKLMVNIET
jgi:hypothetical protein